MAKSKRKTDERLAKRVEAYEDSIKRGRHADEYHRPGSRKKVH